MFKRLSGWLGGQRATADVHQQGDHNVAFTYIVQGGAAVPLPMRRTQWTPHVQDGAGVAALLGWQSRLVPLLGRDDAMAELRAWRDDERFPLSIKLVSAPGGAGKTRLAAEFSEDEMGAWQHGWVTLRDFERAEGLAWQGRWLLIVDYPEHEPEGLERLARLLSQLSSADGQRLRVLLLVREAEGVERVLNEQRCGAFMARRLVLPELLAPEGWSLFSQALADLKQRIQVEPPLVTQQAFDEWQASDTLHRSPLLVLAQAIYWMSEKAAAETASHHWLKGGALLAALMGLERAAWQRAERGHSAPAGSVETTLAWATLCGGLTDAQINQYLAPAWGWSGDGVAALHRSLNSLGSGVEEHTCAPLGPDLLAAQFVTEAWNQPAWQGQAERDASVAEKLLALNDPQDFAPQLNRLHMLAYDQTVRLGVCKPSDAQAIESLLLRWIQYAPAFAAALYRGLCASAGGVALARLGVVLGQRVLRGGGEHLPDEQRARALNSLTICLSETGDSKGALVLAQEATTAYRRLVQEGRPAFEPYLAQSLNNLSICLGSVGDRRGALDAALEAAAIFQGLAEANPAAYEPDLAMSLNSLANHLSATGDRQGTLAPAQKATTILRRLAEANPAAYEPGLARSLNTLANSLYETGDRQGVLAPAQEAVCIQTRLARVNPSAYEPELAGSMYNLARHLSETGDHQGALTTAQDAVIIFRRLAKANPLAHQSDLAMSLSALVVASSETGDQQWSVDAARESVAIRRQIASANPAAFMPGLVAGLSNLANALTEAGERLSALAPAQEAVDCCRLLCEADPRSHAPSLANSLWTLARCFAAAGNRESALAVGRDALSMFTELAKEMPSFFEEKRSYLAGLIRIWESS